MKKYLIGLSFFLSLFILFPSKSFADTTINFTASNVTYDGSTVTFDYTGDDLSQFGGFWYGINIQDDQTYTIADGYGTQSIYCTSSQCTAQGVYYNNFNTPDNNQYQIQLYVPAYRNNGTTLIANSNFLDYPSSPFYEYFNETTPTPTPTSTPTATPTPPPPVINFNASNVNYDANTDTLTFNTDTDLSSPPWYGGDIADADSAFYSYGIWDWYGTQTTSCTPTQCTAEMPTYFINGGNVPGIINSNNINQYYIDLYVPQNRNPYGSYSLEAISQPMSYASSPFYPYTLPVTVTPTPTPTPSPTTLTPTQDTFIQHNGQNQNEGASPFLELSVEGKERALIQFNESQIQAAVGSDPNYTATLQLTIVSNNNKWSTGRQIDVDRMEQAWTEGNGSVNYNNNRGTGSGVTWDCATDSNIANDSTNCSGSTVWDMIDPGSWPFDGTPTATTTITNNQSGTISFNVTSDVQAFLNGTANYGWLVRKDNETQDGDIQFGSKESAYSPKLIITPQ